MFYFDPLYLLFIAPALLITFWAQFKVKTTFAKYSSLKTASGVNGAVAARLILDAGGLANVPVVPIRGNLTDYYDPKSKIVALSQATHSVQSVAAVGVAAHECGHAVQDAVHYFPLKFRNAIIPFCNIGASLAMPAMLLGIFLGSFGLTVVGIVLFSLMVLFQLVTLPVEFNASKRALKTLQGYNMLTQEELQAAKQVLTAAALTYVAALLTSVLQLLYFITRASGSFNKGQRR